MLNGIFLCYFVPPIQHTANSNAVFLPIYFSMSVSPAAEAGSGRNGEAWRLSDGRVAAFGD